LKMPVFDYFRFSLNNENPNSRLTTPIFLD
jgi:hypothetical protein